MGHDQHYVNLGRLMDTKEADKKLEKIAKEGEFLRTIKKVGTVCASVFYLRRNLITFYSLSKKFGNLPNLY